MKTLAAMLLGPGVMALAALAFGRLFLRPLRVRLARGEELALGFLAGAGVLSLVVALLGAAHLARKGVFVAVTAAAVAGAVWLGETRQVKALPAVPRPWLVAWGAVLATFSTLYLLRAVGPELAGGERLGLAFREWDARRLLAWPDPMRMLFLFVFTLGRHPGAAVAHAGFLVALPAAMIAYSRRFGFPAVGVFAALLVFVCPVAAVAGTSALDDLAVAGFLFAAFYLVEVHRQGGGRGALAAAAAMAGLALWLRHAVPHAVMLRGPREMALWGTEAGGLLGPVFLLAPVALLALRYGEGRRLLAAAALVAAPGLAGGEARWLIPALPFVALSMGLAFRRTPGALAVLAAAQALFCWPPVAGLYCDFRAWRVHQVTAAVALRLEPEDEYLNARLPGYVLARLVEQTVPRGAKVFALGEVARAYTTREVVSGGVPRDALLTPLRETWQPARRLRFRFAARRVRALRVRGAGDVAEFRVLSDGRDVPRMPAWRLRARPALDEAGLAFDNSYVTRWSAAASPGAYLEVDFPAALASDGVLLECPRAQGAAGLSLEGQLESGAWTVLAGALAVEDGPAPGHLREAAMEELRARGITYLLVRNADEGAGDFRAKARTWGILPVTEAYDARVYRLD